MCRRTQCDDLFMQTERMIKRLLQQFHQTTSILQLSFCRSIQIGTKLCEHFHLAVLCQINTNTSGCFFHRFCLCGTTNTRYGKTYVYGRSHTCRKQITFQEDLSVCNRNYVGRDVCRYISCLCLDDRKCCDRTSALLFT